MPPSLSVVVRSHNDEPFIALTLERLLSQRGVPEFEIVSCDDASTDRTPEIIAGFPSVRRIGRPEGGYVPGKTLNYAVRHCRGAIVVFNNADAVPQGEDYLAKLTAPLLEDAAVGATFGNQLPRETAEPLVRKDHLRAFGDGGTAAKWKFFFSLASSAVRREELLQYPFSEELQYSEDVEWAYRCVGRGGRLCYVSSARVEHSHNYTAAEVRKRFYNEGRAAARIFGEAPGALTVARQVVAETLRDFAFLAVRPSAWRYFPAAPLRRFRQRVCFMRGARDWMKEAAR